LVLRITLRRARVHRHPPPGRNPADGLHSKPSPETPMRPTSPRRPTPEPRAPNRARVAARKRALRIAGLLALCAVAWGGAQLPLPEHDAPTGCEEEPREPRDARQVGVLR